jgi:hypothetical protein
MKPTRLLFWLNLSACLLIAGTVFAQKKPAAREAPQQATVPLLVDRNRPFVDLTLQRADGSKRTARFLVDSGGGGFALTEPLARDLGLKWGASTREEGKEFAQITDPLKAFVGDFPLELNPARVGVVIGVDTILPKGVAAPHDGMLPGHVLAKYHVVFDYPNAKFTIARAGVLEPKGTALPMPVHPRSGFPRTEIEIDGKTYGFLLDTGASFTMVSEVFLKSLGAAHPDWPRHPGGYGEAATLGGMTLETLFIPGGSWGTNQLTEFGVVSQRQGTFESYMSKMMTAPIVGSLAGNVLKRFRVDLDYPNAKLYLSGP